MEERSNAAERILRKSTFIDQALKYRPEFAQNILKYSHSIPDDETDTQSLFGHLKRRFGELAAMNWLSSVSKIPHVPKPAFNIDRGIIDDLGAKFLRANQIAPISLSNSGLIVYFICNFPPEDTVIDSVKDQLEDDSGTRKSPQFILTGSWQLENIISSIELQNVELSTGDDEHGIESSTALHMIDSSESPNNDDEKQIARKINNVFMRAALLRATDIHFEQYHPEGMRIRMRIDGKLRDIFGNQHIPPPTAEKWINRLKVMSNLGQKSKFDAQDGKFSFIMNSGKSNEARYNIRLSTVPTADDMEKACCRLLPCAKVIETLEDRGIGANELEVIRRHTASPDGMILITGPTGSGKSSTLISILAELNSPEINITTAEDPVEYSTSGINQISINESRGLTFAIALRAILRQDPDLLMIGEIRDSDTLRAATQAAISGHQVLSTLHTNNCPESVIRLMDMGAKPYLISSSLKLLVAQRLLPKVCQHCAVRREWENIDRMKEFFPDLDFSKGVYEGRGCGNCKHTGIHGRFAVCEVMEVDPAVKAEIEQGAQISNLIKMQRAQGHKRLFRLGVEAALEGRTTAQAALHLHDSNEVW